MADGEDDTAHVLPLESKYDFASHDSVTYETSTTDDTTKKTTKTKTTVL